MNLKFYKFQILRRSLDQIRFKRRVGLPGRDFECSWDMSWFGCPNILKWGLQQNAAAIWLKDVTLRSLCRATFVTNHWTLVTMWRQMDWNAWIVLRFESLAVCQMAIPYDHIDWKRLLCKNKWLAGVDPRGGRGRCPPKSLK